MNGVVLGAAVLLFWVGSAPATPSHGVNRSDLGRGTVVASQAFTIADGSDVIVQSITFEVGGNTGWHTHPGNTIELVKSGTITIVYGEDQKCTARTFTAGQAYVGPGHVHLARNDGTTPAELVAIYTGVSPGGPIRAESERPAQCAEQ
jgi:quercetin dioxygenase-like cupin family protein